MNNNIRIIDSIPTRRPLPLMQSIRDAAKLNIQERTTFYVSAYMFQAWICELTLANAAQMAERPDPTKRSFQSGQAWRGFQKYGGKATDAEMPAIFGDLMQFGDCDDPIAAHILHSAFPLSVEHELTGDFIGSRTPLALTDKPKQVIALIRSTIMRLCDWLDSDLHLQVLREWHVMPDCFDPDPKKRELATLAINQRHFDQSSEQSQARFLIHLADAAVEQKNSPNWVAFRQAVSNPPPAPRPWPTENLDTAIIKLWPLVQRYGWSAADLLAVLGKILQPADLQPCLGNAPAEGPRQAIHSLPAGPEDPERLSSVGQQSGRGLGEPLGRGQGSDESSSVSGIQKSKIKTQKSLAALVSYCNNTLSLRWSSNLKSQGSSSVSGNPKSKFKNQNSLQIALRLLPLPKKTCNLQPATCNQTAPFSDNQTKSE